MTSDGRNIRFLSINFSTLKNYNGYLIRFSVFKKFHRD